MLYRRATADDDGATIVHDVSAKLNQRRAVHRGARRRLHGCVGWKGGNNAPAATIKPARDEFAQRYADAVRRDDTAEIEALDQFHKDIGRGWCMSRRHPPAQLWAVLYRSLCPADKIDAKTALPYHGVPDALLVGTAVPHERLLTPTGGHPAVFAVPRSPHDHRGAAARPRCGAPDPRGSLHASAHRRRWRMQASTAMRSWARARA